MSWAITQATPADAEAISAFNARLTAGGVDFQLPHGPQSLGVPREFGAPVWHEVYVANDGNTVRGGYALKRELLFASRESIEIHNYQIPLSEGIIDRRFAMVGIRLLQDALARSSHLYCLGMGSLERPLPRLLRKSGWLVEPVPFFFRVIRANGFLANIEFLRARPTLRLACDLLRYSGLGALGVALHRGWSRLRGARLAAGLTVTEVEHFGAEADDLAQTLRTNYGALVDRTAAALNVRFPRADTRLIRLVIRAIGKPVGWLVLTRNQCRHHKQFGSMRLGCIVDGLADPALVPALVRIGVERLIQENVDLIVSNQGHEAWQRALAVNGFRAGPSNFIFARSPALVACTPALARFHVNRGDGDGPINL